MSKNKKCVACGFEDFEENINNFCCNCGKDIDTGLTMEEMDKQGINYIIDKRVNRYKNDIAKNNIKNSTALSLDNHMTCLDCKQKDQRIAELEKKLAEIKSSVSDLIGFYEMNITTEERAQIENIKRKLEKYGIVKSEEPFYCCLYLD